MRFVSATVQPTGTTETRGFLRVVTWERYGVTIHGDHRDPGIHRGYFVWARNDEHAQVVAKGLLDELNLEQTSKEARYHRAMTVRA